jgi:ferredoxin
VRPDGSIEFDGMSLGCGICIDIARDVMRLLDGGKALKDIRVYVDTTYSRFGPSTPTPPVR